MKTLPTSMRLLAIVPNLFDTSPGQRFRLEQWEPLLKQRGIEIVYHSFEDEELHASLYKQGNLAKKLRLITRAFVRRLSCVRSAKEYDAIYLFREAALLGPAIFERLLQRSNVPIIFDFDDAIFVPYVSPSNGYLSYLKFPAKTKTICRLSTHVMAGNSYLADYARQVNHNVTIIPTTINTEKYQPEDSARNEIPVIGWSGSYSTVQHLDTLRGALTRLAKQQRFKLRVIGTPHYEIEGVDIEAMAWRAETEVADLRPIDIGVMPLPDDKWSLGKCGLKALQYMALGIPTICSPVGVNSEIIRDGENGFLAGTETEWIEKLTLLLNSAELRKRLGLAGRATVEEKYSAISQASAVYNIFEAVTAGMKANSERKNL